jgi:hypothetical protein
VNWIAYTHTELGFMMEMEHGVVSVGEGGRDGDGVTQLWAWEASAGYSEASGTCASVEDGKTRALAAYDLLVSFEQADGADRKLEGSGAYLDGCFVPLPWPRPCPSCGGTRFRIAGSPVAEVLEVEIKAPATVWCEWRCTGCGVQHLRSAMVPDASEEQVNRER